MTYTKMNILLKEYKCEWTQHLTENCDPVETYCVCFKSTDELEEELQDIRTEEDMMHGKFHASTLEALSN